MGSVSEPNGSGRQPPLAEYALLGDGRTAALVSAAGSIDWMCVPRFDSEPVFSRLIDSSGGCFSIRPLEVLRRGRRYVDDSSVLETTWRLRDSVVRMREAMVLDVSSKLLPQVLLVRHLSVDGESTSIRVCFDPRLGLPSRAPETRGGSGVVHCHWNGLVVSLRTRPSFDIAPGRDYTLPLDPSEPMTFVLSVVDREPILDVDPMVAVQAMDASLRWWRAWSDGLAYEGPARQAVVRSLVTLRLLTYPPSGAPVAAPTTSLPERIGGSRNWDYRLAWPRDASLGISSFLGVGKFDEAHSFMHWLLHASRLSRPRIDVLYTLDGRPGPPEFEVDEPSGYRNSTPVRFGNAASRQHQLDVYGWVLDAASRLARARGHLHGETWRAMQSFASLAAGEWQRPDAGIWEIRGAPRHHVHSKVMAWVALDRALQLSKTHRARGRRLARWKLERDRIEADVRLAGFDQGLQSYTRTYGSRDVDASLLHLVTLGFDDELDRLRGTVSAIRSRLSAGGPLLYRYAADTDEIEGQEGAFTACSFWLAEALCRLGEIDEAESLFIDLCRRGTDLGLFAEEIDPTSGEQLGNFPQALSHSALVLAGVAIADARFGEEASSA
jgi:GH15 family glucan-1,4-alpha-glucosidase